MSLAPFVGPYVNYNS